MSSNGGGVPGVGIDALLVDGGGQVIYACGEALGAFAASSTSEEWVTLVDSIVGCSCRDIIRVALEQGEHQTHVSEDGTLRLVVTPRRFGSSHAPGYTLLLLPVEDTHRSVSIWAAARATTHVALWRHVYLPPISTKGSPDEIARALVETPILVECNAGYAQSHDTSIDEMIGMPGAKFLDPDAALAFAKHWVASGYRLDNETFVRTMADGRIRKSMASGTSVFDGDYLVGAAGSTLDLSSAAQTEADKEHSEKLVDRLFKAMPGIGYIYDIEAQQNVLASRQITDFLGFPLGEIKGPGAVLGLFHPEDLPNVLDGIQRWSQADDGEVILTRYRIRAVDGTYRHMSDYATVFERDAEGRVRLMVGTAMDSTEEVVAKQRQEELAALLVQRQSLETIGALSTGIAHDFNNILVVIKGLADLLKRKPGAMKLPEVASSLQEAAAQGQTLASQIVAYARGSSEERSRFDLAEEIERFVAMVRNALPKGKVVASLPESPVPIRAHRDQLQQVLLNLFMNARHATEQGGDVFLSVEATERDGRPGAEIVVRDSGCGMEDEVASKIFEPYYSTRKGRGGSGIGLAVVRRVVDDHRGDITVKSKVDEGTTFRIWIPCDDDGAGEAPLSN